MIDQRVLAAADACITRMRDQPGAEIDRGQMTEPEREAWQDTARETYKQLVGELDRRASCDLVAEAHGIPVVPPDHPFYSEGPTIMFCSRRR